VSGPCEVCGKWFCGWHVRPAGPLALAVVVMALCGLLAAGTASTHQGTPPALTDTARATSAAVATDIWKG
jgi:hypothetical protein